MSYLGARNGLSVGLVSQAALSGRGDGSAPALVEFNFQTGVYLENGTSYALASAPGWTFSRTTTGYGQTVAGVLTSFAIDAPRITTQGLLIEAASQNEIIRSQEFDNASWTKSAMTVSADATAAPDGTTTMDKMVEDAGSVSPTCYRSYTPLDATTYTYSIYAKGDGSGRRYNMINVGGGFVIAGTFTLSGAGTASNTVGSAGIARLGSTDFYRCWASILTVSAVNGNMQNRIFPAATNPPYTGNGADGVFVWGAQFEIASTPSSYIPTTTAAVARGADVASITFTGGTVATVTYGGGLIATVPVTTSLDLGASSGGAWVGSYVESVVVR